MYYLLNGSLKTVEKIEKKSGPYVTILNSQQYSEARDELPMAGEIENIEDDFGQLTKVTFSKDGLAGTFLIPDNGNKEHHFGFIADKKRFIFIDNEGYVIKILNSMVKKNSSFSTSTFRFLYDFMDDVSEDDIDFFAKLEKELDAMENTLASKHQISSIRLAEIRGVIRKYMVYYEQLENLLSEMIENEFALFDQELIQYLSFYLDRIKRLYDFACNIKEYTQEIRDLRKDMIDMRQNDVNTAIAVATTIFLPLNLIAGWYGMNFRYIPELQYRYSYFIVIAISISIVIGMLVYFKKRNWFQ